MKNKHNTNAILSAKHTFDTHTDIIKPETHSTTQAHKHIDQIQLCAFFSIGLRMVTLDTDINDLRDIDLFRIAESLSDHSMRKT